MSATHKKIDPETRETAPAKTLIAEGERVTLKQSFLGAKAGLGLGFLLDGKVYSAPGISDFGYRKKIGEETEIIRDGGSRYDKLYG